MRISDWSSDVCSSDLQGRDRLSLSPEALAVEQAAADDDEAAAAGAEGNSALGQAGGFVRQALETIRHDLGKALQALGFDSDAIQNFSKAFVKPVLSDLKEGTNLDRKGVVEGKGGSER